MRAALVLGAAILGTCAADFTQFRKQVLGVFDDAADMWNIKKAWGDMSGGSHGKGRGKHWKSELEDLKRDVGDCKATLASCDQRFEEAKRRCKASTTALQARLDKNEDARALLQQRLYEADIESEKMQSKADAAEVAVDVARAACDINWERRLQRERRHVEAEANRTAAECDARVIAVRLAAEEDCKAAADTRESLREAESRASRAQWEQRVEQARQRSEQARQRSNSTAREDNAASEASSAPTVLECVERSKIVIPRGAGSVLRAWYGHPRQRWQVGHMKGVMCTDRVRELLSDAGDRFDVNNSLLARDPAPGVRKLLLVEVADAAGVTNILERMERSEIIIPGGAPSVLRAWYGHPHQRWQVGDMKGAICTDQVRKFLGEARDRFFVNNTLLGTDPAVGVKKLLLVEVAQSSHVSVVTHEWAEHSEVIAPRGAVRVHRAWYGRPDQRWRVGQSQGVMCTDRVQDLMNTRDKFEVNNLELDADPAFGVGKVLVVEFLSASSASWAASRTEAARSHDEAEATLAKEATITCTKRAMQESPPAGSFANSAHAQYRSRNQQDSTAGPFWTAVMGVLTFLAYCYHVIFSGQMMEKVNAAERERDEWKSKAMSMQDELQEELGGTICVHQHEAELEREFDYLIWDKKVRNETERYVKISCPGARHCDIHIDIIFNGCIVKIERAASPGVKEVKWETRFQFRPSTGLFEFKEDQATLDSGFLQLVFRAFEPQKREFRFPQQYNLAGSDFDQAWTFEDESASLPRSWTPLRGQAPVVVSNPLAESAGVGVVSAEGAPALLPSGEAKAMAGEDVNSRAAAAGQAHDVVQGTASESRASSDTEHIVPEHGAAQDDHSALGAPALTEDLEEVHSEGTLDKAAEESEEPEEEEQGKDAEDEGEDEEDDLSEQMTEKLSAPGGFEHREVEDSASVGSGPSHCASSSFMMIDPASDASSSYEQVDDTM